MIVQLGPRAEIDAVRRELTALGLWVSSVEKTREGDVFILVGKGSSHVEPERVEAISGVRGVTKPSSPHPKVDALGPEVDFGDGVVFAPGRPAIIAGPCSVESEETILRIAGKLAERGVRVLRGGAFKPRTSPYAFQGKGREALTWLRKAADRHGMKVVTEVLSEQDVGAVAEHAEILQIGSRNMQNFALLRAVGRTKRPVLLKRSMSATIEEWLLAAEYVLGAGSTSVVFCERGIRGFDETTRNLLDLGAVALLAHVHHLPVVVDPSHATGRRELVAPLARAALSAGAVGVMIEVHDDPAHAESDGAQALDPASLETLFDPRPVGAS
jgi:3-deoxy-7-phosphoheptulonate synthase